MKIKFLLAAAALLMLSGCKENIDETDFPDGTAITSDTEFSLTTFNTSTVTTTNVTVPPVSETEELSYSKTDDTAPAETTKASSTTAETTEETVSVTSKTEITSIVQNETTAKTTPPSETAAAEKSQDRGLDDSADICLSKLYFGMSADEAAGVINAEADTDVGSMKFYSNVSFDLDKSFCEGYIVYVDGICQIVMNTTFMTENEALDLKRSLIKKLNKIYSLSDNNWDVGGRGNDICLVNGTITLELTVNKAGQNALVALAVTSPKHMGNNGTEDISVFPPN